MAKYADVLCASAVENADRQHKATVVRPLGDFTALEVRIAYPGWHLSSNEQKLQEAVNQVGNYTPVFFDEYEIFGEEFSPLQCHRFLKAFKLHCDCEVFKYDLRGSIGTMVFLWKVALDTTSKEQRTESIEKVKDQLPQYHTRAMQQEFANKCS